MRYALIIAAGLANAGLWLAPHEIENGAEDWQPPAGTCDPPCAAVPEPPEYVGEGWCWLSGQWVRAVEDHTSAGYGGWRVPSDADRLEMAIAARVATLKEQCEAYIDSSILPYTRGMLRDGVLADAAAETLRTFIADCYVEANSTIDTVEAVSTLAEVDDPAPIYPTYGGAT